MNTSKEDEATRAAVQKRLQAGGAQRALARELGVSRETLLAIACGVRVSRGSLALVRERLRSMP